MKAAILGAQIRLVNQKTKAEFFASTDQTGAAQFGLLPPGVYDVLISASAGFRNHRQVVQIKEAVEPNVKITLSTADK